MSSESIIIFMKNIWKIIMAAAVFISICGCSRVTPSSTKYIAQGYALNTYVKVTLYGSGSDEIAGRAVDMCSEYERIFSRTDEDSMLYRLNNAGSLTRKEAADDKRFDELTALVRSGIEYGKLTDGALDITIEPVSSLWKFGTDEAALPDAGQIADALTKVDYSKVEVTDDFIELNGCRLDLGATAKGYIARKICDYLKKEGVTGAIVDLGGNISCIGTKADGTGFTVGIKKPFDEEGRMSLALDLSDMNIVTSGVYERYFYDNDILYHHILNPATGYPCENGLLSVTVISADAAQCDALSTGCFVLGMDKAKDLVEGLDSVYAVFIDDNYDVYYTKGTESFIKE